MALAERDRGPRGDAGAASSLWIDFLLLPEKLEEHLQALAAGVVAAPTPPDLITVFLEQALMNYKSCTQSSALPLPVNRKVGRTAALLCERAARVAVAADLSLFEIESLVVSQQHQFMLLKALVKHDKSRSLIHGCNFHRWLIRNVLQSHPLASAAPNVVFPGAHSGLWALGEDLPDSLTTLENGVGYPLSGGKSNQGITRDALAEEERLSVEFLEGVIMDESNNATTLQGCQVLLDVGELHFMRGRIRRAHELFTKCSELLADNSAPESSLVPLERLGGFIIACQMLLGIPSNLKSGDESSQSLPNFGDNEYPLASLYPLPPAQRAIIACEQSRCYARQDAQVSSVNRPACYKSITLDTSTKRMRIIPVEEGIQESQQMDGIRFASTQSSFQVPAVVNDTLDGYILWGYRLALEKDPQIVISLRCLLVACNIVRHIIEGCSIESCLGMSNTFQNYREGVEFLMLLMAAVKEGFDREGLSLDSATSITVNSNDNVQMQPLGFTKHNLKRKLEEEACFVNNEALVSHICDSALYICCILEKPWCWDAALKHRLISHTEIPIIAAELSSPPTTSFYRKWEEISGRSAFRSIFKIGQFAAKETHSEVVNISVDVAAILRCQAFHALSSRRQSTLAKRLYKLAFATDSKERDSSVMLWLLEHANPAWQQQGVVGIKSLSGRKKLERSDCDVPRNFGLLKYTLLYLVEKELWDDLAELCQWGTSLLKDLSGMEEKSRERKGFNEGAGNKGKGTSGHIRHKRFAQTLKVAKTLGDLIQLCTSLQTATGFNHFNKDAAVMGSTVWQLFEDFMCMLVGVDAESQSQRVDDVTEPHGIQSGSAVPGARTVPLIPHVTNCRVLTSLASLMAGWLHRCHAVGRTTWPLAVERYGVLAGVTAGASLPPPVGSLPHAASVYRPVPPRVPPEFGRDLFGVLLEGIVQVPGVLEEDKEKGYRWLQGLADLAFEEEAYVKALKLYLQAGAIRSAHYCDRSSSMPRDVFTPWVIRRMVAACRALGASLQAAILCQSLPQPDHESAFHILQENPLVVARDAAAYFDCVWEVPLLELLLYIHAKSGDEEQVTALIALLQQPALNVHNPPSIRIAHVGSLEQRFLQRFAGELL
ncbi:unnamed protein product [Sphagnum troendelagicum]